MKKLYTASVKYKNDKGESDHWFASIDGESYLELSRPPKSEDYEDIASLFIDKIDSQGRKTMHLTLAKRFLDHWGAKFSEL